MSVGPDGLKAAVGHEGWVSLAELAELAAAEGHQTPSLATDVLDVVPAGNGYTYAFPRHDQREEIRSDQYRDGPRDRQWISPPSMREPSASGQLNDRELEPFAALGVQRLPPKCRIEYVRLGTANLNPLEPGTQGRSFETDFFNLPRIALRS